MQPFEITSTKRVILRDQKRERIHGCGDDVGHDPEARRAGRKLAGGVSHRTVFPSIRPGGAAEIPGTEAALPPPPRGERVARGFRWLTPPAKFSKPSGLKHVLIINDLKNPSLAAEHRFAQRKVRSRTERSDIACRRQRREAGQHRRVLATIPSHVGDWTGGHPTICQGRY